MAQAKGVLPTRAEDREVLYHNPQTCGCFVAAKLDPSLDRGRLRQWLVAVDGLVDALVARGPVSAGQDKGPKFAAVAVGLAPAFFVLPDVAPPIEPPASFSPGVALPAAVPPLSSAPTVEADVMFYIASVREARANAFVPGLAAIADTTGVRVDRGYQREDDTEPFGYKDGGPEQPSEDRSATGGVRAPRWSGGRRARLGRWRHLPCLPQTPPARLVVFALSC